MSLSLLRAKQIDNTFRFISSLSSHSTLCWSQDNQLAVTTARAVYILTPTTPYQKHSFPSLDIVVDSIQMSEEKSESLELDTRSVLGGAFRKVCWSPLLNQGCLLLIISFSYSVKIYTNKHPHKTTWKLFVNLSEIIAQKYKEDDAKIISASWNQEAILALGSKSGLITIWRLNSFELEKEFRLPGWISHLEYNNLNLACGLSNGNVYLDSKLLIEDARKISTMKWMDNVLVVAKSGCLYFFNKEVSKLDIPTPGAVYGMTHIENTGYFCTMDGKFYCVDLKTLSLNQQKSLKFEQKVDERRRKISGMENLEDEDELLENSELRPYGIERSPNGAFCAVHYCLFPLDTIYYRTESSSLSFLDFIPVDVDPFCCLEKIHLEPRYIFWDILHRFPESKNQIINKLKSINTLESQKCIFFLECKDVKQHLQNFLREKSVPKQLLNFKNEKETINVQQHCPVCLKESFLEIQNMLIWKCELNHVFFACLNSFKLVENGYRCLGCGLTKSVSFGSCVLCGCRFYAE